MDTPDLSHGVQIWGIHGVHTHLPCVPLAPCLLLQDVGVRRAHVPLANCHRETSSHGMPEPLEQGKLLPLAPASRWNRGCDAQLNIPLICHTDTSELS